LERKPIQVTLHLVDTGIDTGSILYTEIIPVVLGDSVNAVIDKAINKSIDILVDAAITEKSLNFNILYQEKNQGKQYYLMPFKIAQQLEKDWDNILKYYLENYSNGQKL
jgi:folate-dependent phosphoribosylglycinamide formyltransferase PurN